MIHPGFSAKAAMCACGWLWLASSALFAQKPENVLVVVNNTSALSRTVAEYYQHKRAIPQRNVCAISTADDEDVARDVYNRRIAKPIADCLRSTGQVESILYIVTTAGVPLRIAGMQGLTGDVASVDSELTLLYADLHGAAHPTAGPLMNPFFARRSIPFGHPAFPIYLVTRLAGYDFPDIKGLIDRALMAKNRGKFVIDLSDDDEQPGNNWLRTAAVNIPDNRLLLDTSRKVIYDQADVIAYAGWGSNDKNRHRRMLGFHWLPGAIATEYVSTDARTFTRPPENWEISTWDDKDKPRWFAGAPQTLTADFIHEGATGASGHVAEPYLQFSPRPDYLLPAYYQGRNLAESFYLAIPALSWMNIVIGDPLCTLGKP